MPPRSVLLTWLCPAALCLFTGSASSEPAPPPPPPPSARPPAPPPPVVRFPAEQPVPLSARVALLEQKVHALEHRMKAVESAGAAPAEDPCDPPYTVDAKGIRSIKAECLRVGPCEPPYNVDAAGRRSPKKECL